MRTRTHVSANTNTYSSEKFNVQCFEITDSTNIDTRVFSAILVPLMSFFFLRLYYFFNEQIIKYKYKSQNSYLRTSRAFIQLRTIISVSSKENGLEVNVDKTKYMVISRNQKAERIHRINNGNISYESVEEFIYLGKPLKYENYIQEEIKSRLKLENAFYHSM